MYNEEYDNEQETKTNDNFLVNFYYNNKILIWILIGVVAFILIMSLLTRGGSNNGDNTKYDVSILSADENVVVSIGNNYPLRAKVANNSNAMVTWSSTNPDVATVNVDDGTVTAVGYGKTEIYATYFHGDNKYISEPKEVTVADGNPNLVLNDVSFQNGELLMPLNSTYTIRLALNPSNGYITKKSFSSSDTSVVTVNNDGLVTSVGEGPARITLNVNDIFSKELKVYVSSDYTRAEIIVNPEIINIDGELLKMKVGTSEKLKYSLFPTDANSSKLTWESGNEEIVTVDQYGIVKALKSGRTTVTLKSVTGVYDSISIEVEESVVEVTDISFGLNSLYLNVGQSETILPTVSPADASNKTLSYISGDSSVAVVAPNATGTSATVYAVRAGSTTITAISNNNVERRLTVVVSANGSGNNGSGSGSGSGSSSSSGGVNVTSKDANWATTHEGFVVPTYERTKNNAATAPVEITVTKTDSSIARIRVAVCSCSSEKCSSSEKCDPSELRNLKADFVGSSDTFTLTTAGTYLIRVGKYNSKNNLVGTVDKYIAIGNTSSGNNINGNTNIDNKNKKYVNSLDFECSNGRIISAKHDTSNVANSNYSCVEGICSGDNIPRQSGYKYYCCTGKNNYSGSITASCPTQSDNSKTFSSSTITATFNDSCSSVTGVKFNGFALNSSSYTATRDSIIATVVIWRISGKGNYSGEVIKTCTIKNNNNNNNSKKFDSNTITATFNNSCSSVTNVKFNGTTLNSSSYTATKVTSNATTVTWVISGKGNYSGSVTKNCKLLSSLSFSCSGNDLIIKDGSTSLTTSSYCTKSAAKRGNILTYYTYNCKGDGVKYAGTKNFDCPENH